MYNYNIISDEKSYLEGKKFRKEMKKREYEEKCRKLAKKWAPMFDMDIELPPIFDMDVIDNEVHRMFKDDLLKNGIKRVFHVYDYFDEYMN